MHTRSLQMKNLLLIDLTLTILLLTDTFAGSVHDKRIADQYTTSRLTSRVAGLLKAILRWRS